MINTKKIIITTILQVLEEMEDRAVNFPKVQYVLMMEVRAIINLVFQ